MNAKRNLKLKALCSLLGCKNVIELAQKLNVSRAVLYASKLRPHRLGPALEKVNINPRFLLHDNAQNLFLDPMKGFETIRHRINKREKLTVFEFYFMLSLSQERFASLAASSRFRPNKFSTQLLFDTAKQAFTMHPIKDYEDFFVKDFGESDVNYYVCDISCRIILRVLDFLIEKEEVLFIKKPFSLLVPIIFYFGLGALNKEHSVPSSLIDSNYLQKSPQSFVNKFSERLQIGNFEIILFPFKDLFHVEVKHACECFVFHSKFSNFAKVLAIADPVDDDLCFSTSNFSLCLKDVKLNTLKEKLCRTKTMLYYLTHFGCF